MQRRLRDLRALFVHPLTRWVCLPVAAAAALSTALSQTPPVVPPAVSLASTPLYAAGINAKPTLTLALSVEFPTVGAAYRGTNDYSPTVEYLGYFDSEGCYSYSTSNNRFDRYGDATSRACGGSGFSGNFMNWATTSAIDILRYALTGGDRVSESATETVLQRAVIQENFYANGSYFPRKEISSGTVAQGAVPSTVLGSSSKIYIANCLNKVFFGTKAEGDCGNPKDNDNRGAFLTRVAVCGSSGGILNDPRPGYCARYPSGSYKPVGNLQKYSDRMRVAAFGYLNEDGVGRYGGVLRAPMKYVGQKAYDANFSLISGNNPSQEWDPHTGEFIRNPITANNYPSTNPISGVTNYLNQFGRTGAVGKYKSNDPVNELYYEALRYLQGLAPTPAAVSSLTDTIRDGFPVYTTWTDPHPEITTLGSTGDYSCVRNHILTIGDVNTHSDKTIPGNTATNGSDQVRTANPSGNEPDFVWWTKVVGAFESNHTEISYPFVKANGTAATVAVANPNTPNTARWGLESQTTGRNNSYYMAGIAYWANTHDIRGTTWTSEPAKQRPGMRVRSYFIDVNENSAGFDVNARRNNQFYLAAKYGGFKDESDKGNPFYKSDGTVDNSIWQQSNGDAKTYFLASDPKSLIAALDQIFEQIASEASSIAGGAITTQTLTASGGNIYQATFDPNDWSGDVLSYTLGLTGSNSIALGTAETAVWRAAAVLDARTSARNIVVGRDAPTITSAAVDFQWANLSSSQQLALRKSSAAASAPDAAASAGENRLAYIRGDRSLEGTTMRMRGSRLGDIVNSGVVFKGAPTLGINDTGYATFHAANANRTEALYVGANDGMLHAFDASNGNELFAYIPSFLVPHLSELTSTTYGHRSYVDATPAVGEAQLGTAWKTVLVSGVGAGAQGVFALDVTNPSAFSDASVLWEFTDADDPALGNVVGTPRILKLRTSAATATTPTYKWFAVFASGVNNYVDDGTGRFSTTGDPALFFLDLAKPVGTAWAEGSNYFKVTFPKSSTAIASGMVNFSATSGNAGELAQIYAGDLHGNVWKLDFMPNAAANATAVDVSARLGGTASALAAANPLFIAKSGTTLQPITMEPALLVGPNRSTIVAFGTGKFLEADDASSPHSTQSVYAILDANTQRIPSRARLNTVTQNGTTGVLSATSFAWGIPSSDSDMSVRAGWYFDFAGSAASGERQISTMALFGNNLIFGSVMPAQNGCEQGSGNLYAVAQTSGIGTSSTSTVGILGAPFVLQTGTATLTISDSTGLRKRTTSGQIVLQGSSGLTVYSGPGAAMSHTDMVGRLSWREINNFQELKAATP